MTFNGTEGSSITLAQAAELTANYRNNNEEQSQAVFIGIDRINELINREGSKGIRVYFAANDSGVNTIVMVSAFADQNDDLGLIMDNGCICPPICSGANALNGGSR